MSFKLVADVMEFEDTFEYFSNISKYWDDIYKDESFYVNAYNFIERYRKKYNLGKKILDIACGTGILLDIFEKDGYETFGVDYNPEMLKIAKKKLKNAKLFQGVYEDIPLDESFPIIISTYNSMAYIIGKEKFNTVIKSITNKLDYNGLFIFDIFAAENNNRIFDVKTIRKYNILCSRTFYGTQRDNLFYFQMVHIIIKNNNMEIITEKGIQSSFSNNELKELCKAENLIVQTISDGYMEGAIIIILQKISEAGEPKIKTDSFVG